MSSANARRALSGLLTAALLLSRASGQPAPRPFEHRGGSLMPAAARSSVAGQGAAPFDVLSYRLDLTLAMVSEDLAGRNLITLVMKAPADSLLLYQLKLQIDSVTVDGVPRPFAVDDAAERFTVRLGSTRQTGDTLRVAVAYRRLPGVPRLTARLGYYYFRDTIPGLPANLGYTMSEPSDARCWMPCYDEPWEKATAEFLVTVPQGYVVASNGRFLGAAAHGDGTATWHWKEDHQIATYLMSATVSKFTNPSSTLVIAPGDTIPVEYFAWPRDSNEVAAFLPTVRRMITVLGNLFGPYPWDKYGMSSITPFAFGGMEHQTITTIHEAYQTDEDVVVHELAHQWWGDLVTCGTWADIWLNESFATYSEALWHESGGGQPALRAQMAGMRNFNLGSWLGGVYDPEGQGIYLFSDLVYSKGAWVLHMLRGAVGDSAFFRTLRLWRALYGGGSAVTADFRAAAESVSGQDLGWFFNEWMNGPGWPVYAMSYAWQAGVLGIRIAQQQASAWPSYTMPLRVRVSSAGRDTTVILRDSLRVQDFQVPYVSTPDSVRLDPDGWALSETGTPISPPIPPGTALGFSLAQSFPNPFNLTSTITYTVPGIVSGASAPLRVTLAVYDILGRRVTTLVDADQLPGEYVAGFDGGGHASGVYFYRLQVRQPGGSAMTAVRKMVLVR